MRSTITVVKVQKNVVTLDEAPPIINLPGYTIQKIELVRVISYEQFSVEN